MLPGRGLVNVEAFLLDLSPVRAVAGRKFAMHLGSSGTGHGVRESWVEWWRCCASPGWM